MQLLKSEKIVLNESIKLDSGKLIQKCEIAYATYGRLNKTEKENVYVDYAHSPKALESVCKYLYKKKKNKLIIVFGAGGERDEGKRYQMGEIADKYCEKIY